MSNAHKIIKNFTSDKFSPELKEKLWKWLVDSSEQAEKDEALMELWEDPRISKPMQVLNVPIRTSAGKLRPDSGRQLQGIPCANGCRWRLYYWFPCSL